MYTLTVKIKSEHIVLIKSFLDDLTNKNLKEMTKSLTEADNKVLSEFKNEDISFSAELTES